MTFIKLTSAVGVGRAPIYVNANHIVSFSDQTGGCQLKMNGGASVIAVREKSDLVAQLIDETTVAR